MKEKKKILLTGGRGFLGSTLFRNFSDTFEITLFEGDVTRELELLAAFSNKSYDIVIHLAGLSSNKKCNIDLQNTLQVNSLSLLKFKEILSQVNFSGSFLFFSTAHVYGTLEGNAIKEDSIVHPVTQYGVSKWLAEEVLMSGEQDFQILILRLFNTTHQSQGADFLFPYLIEELKQESTDNILVGNLELVRDFTSLQSFLSNFLEVLQNLKLFPQKGIFNFGSGQGRNLRVIFDLLKERLKSKRMLEVDASRLRPGEPRSQVACVEKILNIIDYQVESDQLFVDQICTNI